MRRKLRLLSVLAVAAASVAALPLAASADESQRSERFAIGQHLSLTGPNSSQGTFAAAGAISDAGTVESSFTITPTGPDRGIIEGDQTFVGSRGSFVLHFRGPAFPLTEPRTMARGRATIVEGTGAYEDLEGRGRFVVVADLVAGTVTGSLDGRASGSPDDDDQL